MSGGAEHEERAYVYMVRCAGGQVQQDRHAFQQRRARVREQGRRLAQRIDGEKGGMLFAGRLACFHANQAIRQAAPFEGGDGGKRAAERHAVDQGGFQVKLR